IRRVLRHAGQIDVHVVSYEASRHPRSRHRGAITWSSRRRGWAWLIMAVGLPALNWLLLSLPGQLRLENVLLIYLLGAVVVGLIGGALPAAIAAVLGFLLANFFFTPPLRTWTISDAGDLVTLVVFLLVATLVGTLVGLSTRRAVAADRARAQAEALAATASLAHPVLGANAGWTLARIRDAFSLEAAAILRQGEVGWTPLVTVGSPTIGRPDDGNEVIPISADAALVLRGGSLTAEDRRVLAAFVAQMVQALEWERLEREAATAEAMAETNRMRTALLNAVSHDLRTPLATIKASVTSLLETGVAWSPEQVAAFHHTILGESERLNRLVGNLLDASRLQAGAVHVFFNTVGLDEVVAAAVASLGRVDQRLEIDVPETLPQVQTDAALLERVVANLIENALAVSEGPVRVAAGAVAGRIDLRITDRGPGIPPLQRELVFEPFHRLSGTGHRHGVGLGLTVSRGFLEAMGNELTIEDTPGGGTTMVIAFKPARPPVPAPSGVATYE
ncbi:MAG TPA: DUF4118 domain-containing protein, partial [Acidimicrobiia bacterium]|nr:DUF4118 domain-containing protein [Acidimicrobiia bacterium]